MKKKLAIILAALTAALMLCSCQIASSSEAASDATSPSSTAPETNGVPGLNAENCPSIDGSTANHPLIRRIYAEINGITPEEAETLVNLDLGSTGSIWTKLINGYGADLSIVYEPPEEVKSEYVKELENFEIDPIGRDGLVFLANANNKVDNLSIGQLQDIYTGKLTDWSEVGGEPGPIQPFQRNADSGSQTLFLKLLMNGLTPMQPPTELVQVSMGGLIDGVAEFNGAGSALGYSVYYYANLMYTYPNLKLLSVDGIAPSNESIESKSYPLTNDFYLVLSKDAPADSPARMLRDWLLTEDGRGLLESENYVWARSNLPMESAGAGNPFAK